MARIPTRLRGGGVTMPTATLTWTALPSGLRRRDDGGWRARVAVFVAMRLDPENGPPTLAAFEPLLDWPATLGGAAGDAPVMTVFLTGPDGSDPGPGIPATVMGGGAGFDSVGWRAIFTDSTRVVAPDAPGSSPLLAAPDDETPAAIADGLRSYPATDVLRRIREVYAQSLDTDSERKQAFGLNDFAAVASGAAPFRGAVAAGSPGAAGALAAMADFLKPAADAGPRLRARPHSDVTEFHQVMAGISGHPALLRRLGLVLDLELPADALGLADAGDTPRIAVVPGDLADPGGLLQHVSPWTATEVAAATSADYRTFCAAHAPTQDAKEGPVHAGMRALPGGTEHVAQEHLEHAFAQLVQHASEIEARPRGSEADRAVPPALMQVGMRMLDDTAGDDLAEAIAAQKTLLSALQAPGRDAADTRMRSQAPTPPPDGRPLYARDLTRGFRVDVQDVDAGTWRSLCRRSNNYAAGDWKWPKDGTPVEDEGTVTPIVYEDANVEKTTYRVVPELFTWDGWSLVVPHPDAGVPDPDATPGATAAGPVTVETGVPAGSLQPQRFGQRYRFRARSVDIAGNSLTSDEADALQPAARPVPGPTSAVPCLRVENVPPPVVFPAQPRGPGEAGGDVIVVRDAESPAHRTRRFRLHVLPPRTSVRTAERHGLFDDLSPQASWALIESHSGSLERDAQGERRDFVPARTLGVPYLPDPMARAAVMVLPGDRVPVQLPRFDTAPRNAPDDPLAMSFALVVAAGNNDLHAEVAARTVTLTVPKGRITHVRLAASLDEAALELMALADREWTALRSPEALRKAVATGNAPALAPSRTLEIVHATQRPLTAPVFVAPALVRREKRSTRAVLRDPEFLFDLPSSGRLDVYASWEETIDDPALPAWRRTRNALHAGGQTLRPDDGQPFTAPDPDPEDADAPEGDEAPSGSRPPTLEHDFGDTRHRVVTYSPVATSRFASFYPAELTADPANITREGPAITLHVPSTAPPDAPDVAYVVPTFERQTSRLPGNKRTATQRGFGLRVYLRRGWFSSGDGEQLALVLGPAGGSVRVSEWGTDPTIESAALPGPLGPEQVASGGAPVRGGPAGGGGIVLVPHEVSFGEAQGLPFADITFRSQPTALPLVRLALARYQPHAISDCHVSEVVRADFVPLAPDRYLTVSAVSLHRWSIALLGQGYRDAAGATGIVEARIEQQPLSARADDAAWQPASDTTTLDSAIGAAFEVSWRGELELYADAARGRWRRRLVLREFTAARPGDAPLGDRARLVSVQTVPL